MWGRRTTRDNDAATAAQRRLAAIAAEFDRRPGPDVPEHDGPPALPGSPRPAPTSSGSGSSAGRHRGEAGVWDWGRWRLSVHQVALVALLVAALVAVAAWWALRAVPETEPVPLATARDASTPPAAPGAGGPTSAGTPPAPTPTGGVPVSDVSADPDAADLVVDVAGKVRRPGIVELPPGSRVVDALAAAGGTRKGIDTAGLNLARPLVDGEQIVVGLAVPAAGLSTPGPASGPTLTGPALASIDVNTATQAELETLPGIGPVTAQSILEWRSENGAFTSVDDLLDVSGIGDATLADIEPYVHV